MGSASDFLGGPEDVVRLEVGDVELAIAESYEVHRAVFTRQPCSFSLRLGHGAVVADILDGVRPGMRFSLYVGDALQFTGTIDDVEAEGDDQGSMVTIVGRDDLAPLHDAYVLADVSFSNVSYADLLEKVLFLVDYPKFAIRSSNDANRIQSSGISITTTKDPILDDQAAVPVGAAVSATSKACRFKPGGRWFEKVSHEFMRGGLALWAMPDYGFVLSVPNANQVAKWRVVRQLPPPGLKAQNASTPRVSGNVLSGRFNNRTSNRFSMCRVYARGGGGKAGRTQTHAEFVDEEMTALGVARPLIIRDSKATNFAQAEKLARRKIADANRANWNVEYTVSGHLAPYLGGGGDRAVWTVDTIVDVQDDLLGIHRPLYLESVVFRRDATGGTTTVLTLMRPEDLVFTAGEFE